MRYLIKLKKICDILICSASGAVASMCMYSSRFVFMAFFSMIPLVIVIFKSENLKKTEMFRKIFFFYLVFTAVSLSWLSEINVKMFNGKTKTFLLIILLIIAASAVHAVIMALSICVYASLQKNNIGDVFVFALLFILGEWFHETLYPVTFPWFRMAVSVTSYSEFIQSANLLGSLFISFLIVVVNALLAYIICNVKCIKRLVIGTEILVLIFSLNVLYGKMNISRKFRCSDDIPVILLQSNIGENQKHKYTDDQTLDYYISALKNISYNNESIVVLPESAMNFNITANSEKLKMIADIANSKNINVVFGFYSYKDKHKYNSMAAIYPNGKISEIYSKKILVPFGEMIPLEWLAGNKIRNMFTGIGEFSKGGDEVTIDTGCGCAGCIICYESLYPSSARKAVSEDAEFLIILSNDSWFSGSSEVAQHHSHSILRAVENSRYVIRCSTTGITSVISPTGQVISKAPENVVYTLKSKISCVSGKSLYSIIGDVIIIPSAFVFIAGILKKKNNKEVHPEN